MSMRDVFHAVEAKLERAKTRTYAARQGTRVRILMIIAKAQQDRTLLPSGGAAT